MEEASDEMSCGFLRTESRLVGISQLQEDTPLVP